MNEFKWDDSFVDELLASLRYTDAADRKSTVMYFKKSKQQSNILMNKPCLSLNDVINIAEQIQFHNRPNDRGDEDYLVCYISLLEERLKQLAQQKINNGNI